MHSLKGAAVGVGAVKLASLASDLDESVDKVKFAEIVNQVRTIEMCFESTAMFLKRYLETHHQ
jgi:chemotaxis protein histidine kinase CheA